MMMEAFKLRDGLTVEFHGSRAEACEAISDEVGSLIAKPAVLGLATGSTPVPLYAEWARRFEAGRMSFADVVSFNLDEYEGLPPEHPQSYHAYMRRHLFDPTDLRQGTLPPGCFGSGDVDAICADYERRIAEAGGIDWQLLGIGRSGHIGFNEPGSAVDSRTRRVKLAESTREDAAKGFGGLERVPTNALTMGIGTILEARRIVLTGWGEGKSRLIERALTGSVDADFPASFLQNHGNLRVVIAEADGLWP